MIHSIFLLNSTGEVIIEKHYRGTTARPPPIAPTPIAPTPSGANIYLTRNGLTLLATIHTDTPPLFVTQFLEALAEVLTDYFGELNEHAIKDNFITVYELLDEMLDNGTPATLEPNALKELIAPPSMINRVFETLGAETSRVVNAPALLPWRRANVRHAQNEVFVDIEETVHAVFTPRGLSHHVIQGMVNVTSRLSGMPAVEMRLRATPPLDDVALHHCAKLSSFQQSGSLSFIPPDGPFTLMRYTMRDVRGVALPVQVTSRIDLNHTAGSGHVSVSLTPRFTPPPLPAPAPGGMMLAQVMTAAGSKAAGEPEPIMNSVVVRIPFGKGVTGVNLSANYGTVQFADGYCTWNIGDVMRGKTPSIVGNITLGGRVAKPAMLLQFRIPGVTASGMGVESLEIGSERYKYYKGLKCVTRAGLYEVRT